MTETDQNIHIKHTGWAKISQGSVITQTVLGGLPLYLSVANPIVYMCQKLWKLASVERSNNNEQLTFWGHPLHIIITYYLTDDVYNANALFVPKQLRHRCNSNALSLHYTVQWNVFINNKLTCNLQENKSIWTLRSYLATLIINNEE